MVTQIRNLAVSAGLDATSYSAGAQQKVAADRAMSASGKEAAAGITAVGAAVAETTTKVSVSVDTFERFKRANVDGYAAAADFEKNMRTLAAGLDKGKISLDQAASAVENLQKKYGVTADAATYAGKGQTDLARAIETVNSAVEVQLSANDKLIASYRLMAAEAKAAFAADQAQNTINARLGVRSPQSGTASASASVFSAQLDRTDQLNQLRANQNGQNFNADVNAWAGVNGFGTSARDSAAVFEEEARQADKLAERVAALRAQLDPVAASQARLNAELAEYDKLAASSQITTEELTRAQALARARHDEVASTYASGGHSAGLQRFQAQDIAYQGQDTITQALGGANPGLIGVQQGPQLAMAFAGQSGKEALSTLGSGLTALLNPVTLISVGLVAAGAAAIQFGIKTFDAASKADEVMKKHEETLKSIKQLYDDASKSSAQYGQQTQAGIEFANRQDSTRLNDLLKSQLQGLGGSLNFTGSRSALNDATKQYGPLFDTIRQFDGQFQKGTGSITDFNAQIERIANADPANAQLQKAAGRLRDLTKDATSTTQAIKALNDEFSQTTLVMARTNEAAAVAKYQDANSDNLADLQRRQAASLGAIGARTPAQLAEAARQNVAAEPINPSESVENRQYRIDSAGALAQAQAEHQLADAQKDRGLALQKLIDDEQFDISLVGKTADQAALLRKEYDLTSAIRLQAARDGTDVDQKEIDLIHQRITELGKLQVAYKVLSTGVTSRGPVIGSPAEQEQFDYQAEQQVSLDQGKEAFNAQLAGVRARTVAQRVAAARQAASAQHPDESADQRTQRIDQAGALAQAQAEQQLADAQRERKIGLDQILTDQQLEISLVGKTAGETAALRKEYELTSQLRLEAAKNGTEVDQKELDLIKKRSEELGKLADAYAKAKLNDDLSFERDQIFRSANDQQIASRQRSAGLPVDLQSPEAQIMRQNLQASAINDGVTGFISDFRQQLVSNGGKVGDAFGTALRNAALNALTKIGDEAANTLGNLFVKMLTGTSPGGAGVATASTGGLLGTLFGGGSKSGGLQAANSNVAATGASSIAGGAVDKAMSLLGTNEKTGTGDINAFLKAGGVDVNAAQTAWCAGFVNSSLAQVGIKGSGSQVATSFLDWGSKVDPSQILKGDVLVQSRGLSAGEEGGHVGLATGASRVVDGQQQLQMLSGNSANSVQTTWVNAMNVQARRATDAANSLTKLAGSTGQATQGLGQLGQSLSSSFFPAAPAKSGGGIGGWLSSLFMPNFSPIGAQATKAASGSITGLFANGTDFSPEGTAVVGEQGPEIVNLPRGSQVVPAQKTRAIMSGAANSNDGGGGRTKVDVGVSVDNDGNLQAYVKKVSKQHADEAVNGGLFNYSEGMRRQGIGTLNARYNSQKA